MEGLALITALAVAIGSAVYRRPAPPPTIQAPSAVASTERPRALPTTYPRGEDARTIRSFDAWTLHPGHEVSPRGVVAAFLLAESGRPQTQCDLIDDLIEGDSSLRNLFEQREQSVAGKEWVMQGDGPDENSAIAAQVLGTALRRLPMSDTFLHLLAANRYGWGAAEIDWAISEVDGRPWIIPVWFANVASRRFRISQTGELRLFADITRPDGDELRAGKWLIMKRPGSNLARAGLMRTAAWPAVGKRLGWRDWLIFSQRFGIPMPLASYDPDDGEDDEVLAVAEEIVRKIGSDVGAVKPKSIELEMLEATAQHPNDKTHGGLIAHCNAEMAKLIAGATLTNDNAGSGGASYALGEVHAAVRWDNVIFDASRLQEAFRTQVCVPFMRFNNLTGPAPLLTIQVVRDLSPMAMVEMGVRLTNQLGVKVSASQMRQVTGLRAPVNAEDEAPGMQVQSFPAASGGMP